MEKKEIYAKALESVKKTTFICSLYAGEGGTCGDSWSDNAELALSRAELLWLINEVSHIKEYLPENEKMEHIDVENVIQEMADEAAFPDDIYCDDDENFDEWSCGGNCETLEFYITAWYELCAKIESGEITGENLNEWLEYFDDEDNLECGLEEWHSEHE